MDIETFSKWFQALGPSSIMGVFFYFAARWFNASFWPWFQKLFERQVTVIESLSGVISRVDLQLAGAITNQNKHIDDTNQIRYELAVLNERLEIVLEDRGLREGRKVRPPRVGGEPESKGGNGDRGSGRR